MCTYFLMEEGLSTKDSLGRVHSVFGSPNREEYRQQGARDLKFFTANLNSTGGAHCFGRTDFTSISTRPSIV